MMKMGNRGKAAGETRTILRTIVRDYLHHFQSPFTCSKLTIEALEQGVKYVQG